MGIEGVESYAEACSQRTFLAGVLDGNYSKAGVPFHLGRTERAIVEGAMRSIEQGKSILIENPFPAESVPLAIGASYYFHQHPQMGGDGRPMLVFPHAQKGYVGQFDKFHFPQSMYGNDRTITNRNPRPLIQRSSVTSLGDVTDSWQVFTAQPAKFHFTGVATERLNAVFVDLRHPEWGQRRFTSVQALLDDYEDVPFIFYTNDMDAYPMLSGRLAGTMTVTGEMLSGARPAATIEEGESALSIQERLLAAGDFDFRYYPLRDDDLAPLIETLYDTKCRLQDANICYFDVGKLFNRLLKEPTMPTYWDSGADGGHFETLTDQMNRLEQMATRTEGVDADLLNTYVREARTVYGHLNEQHIVQNVVLSAIESDIEAGEHTTYVVKNSCSCKALIEALREERDFDLEAVSAVDIVTSSELAPTLNGRVAFLYPPYSGDYTYQFPPAPQVAYLHHEWWAHGVRRSSERETRQTKATHTTIDRTGAEGATPTGAFDMDEVSDDLTAHIKRSSFGNFLGDTGKAITADGGVNAATETGDDDGVTLTLELEGGQTLALAPGSPVSLYDKDHETVVRKTARNVKQDDQVLVIDERSGDIYDLLIQSDAEREEVRRDQEIIDNWRGMMNAQMDREGLDSKAFLKRLRESGSALKHASTVELWRDGSTHGPGDDNDVKHTIDILMPDAGPEMRQVLAKTVCKALHNIRSRHAEIGKNVRRAIEAEVDPTVVASYGDNVDKTMVRTIKRDIKPKRVIGTRSS